MKLKKAKILLDKINKLFSEISEKGGKPSSMERDLILNYLRDFYDLILEGDQGAVADTTMLQYQALLKEKEESLRKLKEARDEAEKKAREERLLREEAEKKAAEELKRQKILEEAARKAAKAKEEEEARKKEAVEKELLKQAELKAAEDARKKAELDARLKIEQELKLKAAREAAEKAAALKESEKVVSTPTPVVEPPLNKGPQFNVEMEELFEEYSAMDLSQKISLRPIKNINKAISINDRLLYINELFDKEAPEMEQVINTLNNLENFNQARLYLEQKVVDKYNWTAKKRKKRAIEFINVIRRRFL